MKQIKIGMIGCGNISSIYMKNIPQYNHLTLKACADLDEQKARSQAEKFNIPKVYTVEELLNDDDIDLVINLTIPQAHADVCIKALEANKHVYIEKPLAVTREEGKHMLQIANEKGLRVGCAPDTFLGAGIQTAIKLIQDDMIGIPVGASAFMIGRGHEHWHPDPGFYYEKGGGPMFDMGPYYLTALIAMLGPIKRLSGSTQISFPEREILSEPKAGTKMQVKTPTHIAGTIDFSSGAIGTITTSFDAFGGSSLPNIEVYGSKGTIIVPDPNTFGGPVKLRKRDEDAFVEVPLTHQFAGNSRGLGVADMAYAILNNETHRVSGQLAYHVLEAMHGFHDASDQGTFYNMESSVKKPELLHHDILDAFDA